MARKMIRIPQKTKSNKQQNLNTMKKQLIVFSLSLMSMGIFAQKNELKAAAKALKKQNYAGAVASISAAEALMSNMDVKLKAKFYFLKAQAYAGQKKYSTAADAFSTLFAFEKQTGKQKYTSKAKPMLGQLTKEVSEKALKLYNNEKDYAAATLAAAPAGGTLVEVSRETGEPPRRPQRSQLPPAAAAANAAAVEQQPTAPHAKPHQRQWGRRRWRWSRAGAGRARCVLRRGRGHAVGGRVAGGAAGAPAL